MGSGLFREADAEPGGDVYEWDGVDGVAVREAGLLEDGGYFFGSVGHAQLLQEETGGDQPAERVFCAEIRFDGLAHLGAVAVAEGFEEIRRAAWLEDAEDFVEALARGVPEIEAASAGDEVEEVAVVAAVCDFAEAQVDSEARKPALRQLDHGSGDVEAVEFEGGVQTAQLGEQAAGAGAYVEDSATIDSGGEVGGDLAALAFDGSGAGEAVVQFRCEVRKVCEAALPSAVHGGLPRLERSSGIACEGIVMLCAGLRTATRSGGLRRGGRGLPLTTGRGWRAGRCRWRPRRR